MPFLIDGHNLIAALPDIDLEDPHDEAKLVIKLRAWAGHYRRKAIIVFDGGIPGGYSQALSSGNLEVVFAAHHHTIADRIIIERLRPLRDAVNWTVVSSDIEVLDAARQAGARALTSQEFATQLTWAPEKGKEKPDWVSQAEVQSWLQVFKNTENTEAAESAGKGRPGPKRPQATGTGSPSGRPAEGTPGKVQMPEESTHRTTRTIAEQVGYALPDEPQAAAPKPAPEKPEEVPPEELAAWLEVFHDLPSTIPPPPKPKTRTKPGQPRPLTVAKGTQGGLSEEEVTAWLEVFPETPETEAASPQVKGKSMHRSPKLQKRKEQQTYHEDTSELSPEDREEWQRIFGKEP